MSGSHLEIADGLETYDSREVYALFRVLCEGYYNGRLTANDFRASLKDLLLRDEAGTLWTIGARSGRWYRRDGDGWVRGEPTGPLVSAHHLAARRASVPTAEALHCPRCRAELPSSARFCLHCGARAPEPVARVPQPGPAPVPCPRCAAPNPAGGSFCGRCGAELGPPRQEPLRSAAADARAPAPTEGVPAALWLWPIFLALPGGLVAWLTVRGRDAGKARRMLWLGLWMTIVWFMVASSLVMAVLDLDLF